MKTPTPLPRFRTILSSAILCGLAIPCLARPVKTWAHQELFQCADAVLVLAVTRMELAQEKPASYGIADTYQAHRAHCRVLGVLKGEAPRQEMSLLFFQHPDGRPGFNGVIPAPLSRDARLEYLAYLRREKESEWVPVTGHENAGQSIRAIMKSPDMKHLDLPSASRAVKPNCRDQPPTAAAGRIRDGRVVLH